MITQNSYLRPHGIHTFPLPAWAGRLPDGRTYNTCPAAGVRAASATQEPAPTGSRRSKPSTSAASRECWTNWRNGKADILAELFSSGLNC